MVGRAGKETKGFKLSRNCQERFRLKNRVIKFVTKILSNRSFKTGFENRLADLLESLRDKYEVDGYVNDMRKPNTFS